MGRRDAQVDRAPGLRDARCIGGAVGGADPRVVVAGVEQVVDDQLQRGARQEVAEAERRGYRRLSLETGAQPGFEPARQLYARAGFTACGPFADYTNDPNSVFMTKEL